jgi:hypothetical protein
MKRELLERLTASLVVTLITIFSVGLILIVANGIFQWDIFTPFMEKILYFLAVATLIVILSSTAINIMINISRLAFFSQKIAEKLLEEEDVSPRSRK